LQQQQQQKLPEGQEQKEPTPPSYLFSVTNHHCPDAGQPPVIDDTRPRQYRSYFENEFGEQAIFVYDYATEQGILYMGDAGWENPVTVDEGRAKGLIVSQSEQFWLLGCWMAATRTILEQDGTFSGIGDSSNSSSAVNTNKTKKTKSKRKRLGRLGK
jgi:hypothetical protein